MSKKQHKNVPPDGINNEMSTWWVYIFLLSTIPALTLCSLDRFCRMVDVYNYIIRVVNILTFIYLFSLKMLWFSFVLSLRPLQIPSTKISSTSCIFACPPSFNRKWKPTPISGQCSPYRPCVCVYVLLWPVRLRILLFIDRFLKYFPTPFAHSCPTCLSLFVCFILLCSVCLCFDPTCISVYRLSTALLLCPLCFAAAHLPCSTMLLSCCSPLSVSSAAPPACLRCSTLCIFYFCSVCLHFFLTHISVYPLPTALLPCPLRFPATHPSCLTRHHTLPLCLPICAVRFSSTCLSLLSDSACFS